MVINMRFPAFQKRFAELRVKHDMSQEEFAQFLNMSRPTIGFYENGDRIPDALTLKNISVKCGVSSDYLLGLSDVKTIDMNTYDAGFANGYKACLSKVNKAIAELSLNISQSTQD
jgi:transcriptional regulator with XRE-family HTH domain